MSRCRRKFHGSHIQRRCADLWDHASQWGAGRRCWRTASSRCGGSAPELDWRRVEGWERLACCWSRFRWERPSRCLMWGDPSALRWRKAFRRPSTALRSSRRKGRPIDADVGHRFGRSEIDDNPLRVSRIRLTAVFAGKIGIALPVGVGIAVGQAGVAMFCAAVACVPAVRQRVSVGVADRILQLGAAGEVSALVGGVAPGAIWIPVPRAN